MVVYVDQLPAEKQKELLNHLIFSAEKEVEAVGIGNTVISNKRFISLWGKLWICLFA
jgi:hypothetical protein